MVSILIGCTDNMRLETAVYSSSANQASSNELIMSGNSVPPVVTDPITIIKNFSSTPEEDSPEEILVSSSSSEPQTPLSSVYSSSSAAPLSSDQVSSSSDSEPAHTLITNDSMYVLFKEDDINPDSAVYFDTDSIGGQIGIFSSSNYAGATMLYEDTDSTTHDGSYALHYIGTKSWGGVAFAFGDSLTDTRDLSYWSDATLYFDIKSTFIPQIEFEWGSETTGDTNTLAIWLDTLGLKDDNEWTSLAIPLTEYFLPEHLEEMRIIAKFSKVATDDYELKFGGAFTPPHLKSPEQGAEFFLDNVYIGGKPTIDCYSEDSVEYCRGVEE